MILFMVIMGLSGAALLLYCISNADYDLSPPVDFSTFGWALLFLLGLANLTLVGGMAMEMLK